MALNIRDRVIEFIRVPASSLRPSPRNWRTHGTAQRDALKGILAEVGYAGAQLARRLPDGSLELIDGHLRAEEMGDQPVPVLVTDLTADEAGLVLATYDPISAMAGADAAKLDELLKSLSTGNDAVMALLEQTALNAGITPALEPEDQPGGPSSIPTNYQILLEFADERTQAEWLERLTAEGLNCRSLIS